MGDEHGDQIVTFCPGGHKTTCNGCVKVLDEDGIDNPNDLMTRVNWMIRVVTGYTRESLELLGWEPNAARVLECACSGQVRPITYGGALGYYCLVKNPRDITPGCGPNILCRNDIGQDLVHFCPDGYDPSCTEGCLPLEGQTGIMIVLSSIN